MTRYVLQSPVFEASISFLLSFSRVNINFSEVVTPARGTRDDGEIQTGGRGPLSHEAGLCAYCINGTESKILMQPLTPSTGSSGKKHSKREKLKRCRHFQISDIKSKNIQ